MYKKKRIILILLVVLSTTVVAGLFSSLYSDNSKDIYYNLRKYITVFGDVYKEVSNNYVEEIDPERFIRAGIQGMLDELDPYTVYLEEEGKDELEIMTRGKYFGVGMRISTRNGWPTVAEQPFPNSPAASAGIREGDQVIEIDGISTKGDRISKTASRLRGTKKGSEVRIKIRRVGVEKPIELTLIRDEIVVSEIEFSGFVEPGIGLIRLTRFNRGAGKQVRRAVEELRDKGMTSLIFDLRGNPGGLLDVAVSVLENFVPRGELVVYTEGREGTKRQDYRTRIDPVLGNLPMVVLVDGFSASASEIVAGAIQDLDRGVIAGSESFGKGLVQTVVNLDSRGEAKLKITTAQYFIPSGRLIQRPEVFNRGRGSVFVNSERDEDETENAEKKQEKDKKVYFTKNNRQVHGEGGIKPDIIVKNEKTTRYVAELRRKSMFFNFSLNYMTDHTDELKENLQITDEILNDFNQFVQGKDFDYTPDGFKELEDLEKISKEENYYELMEPYFQDMRKEFNNVKEKEKQKSADDIRFLLKRELTAKLFGNEVSYKAGFERDQVLLKAIGILNDPEEYNKTLNVKVAAQN